MFFRVPTAQVAFNQTPQAFMLPDCPKHAARCEDRPHLCGVGETQSDGEADAGEPGVCFFFFFFFFFFRGLKRRLKLFLAFFFNYGLTGILGILWLFFFFASGVFFFGRTSYI